MAQKENNTNTPNIASRAEERIRLRQEERAMREARLASLGGQKPKEIGMGAPDRLSLAVQLPAPATLTKTKGEIPIADSTSKVQDNRATDPTALSPYPQDVKPENDSGQTSNGKPGNGRVKHPTNETGVLSQPNWTPDSEQNVVPLTQRKAGSEEILPNINRSNNEVEVLDEADMMREYQLLKMDVARLISKHFDALDETVKDVLKLVIRITPENNVYLHKISPKEAADLLQKPLEVLLEKRKNDYINEKYPPEKIQEWRHEYTFRKPKENSDTVREKIVTLKREETAKRKKLEEQAISEGKKPEEIMIPVSKPSQKDVNDGETVYNPIVGDQYNVGPYTIHFQSMTDSFVEFAVYLRGELEKVHLGTKTVERQNLKRMPYLDEFGKGIVSTVFRIENEIAFAFNIQGHIDNGPLTYVSEKAQAISVAMVSAAALITTYVFDAEKFITKSVPQSGIEFIDTFTQKISGMPWTTFVWGAVGAMLAYSIPKIILSAKKRKKDYKMVTQDAKQH